MWRQGDHAVIVGMTGSGKTTLAHSLLDRRGHAVMLVTKPDDLPWTGWRTVTTADRISPRKAPKWRLMPAYERAPLQFKRAFDLVWREGSWCLYVDETYHVQNAGLQHHLVKLLTQGRSKRITVVSGVQRPSWVRREVFSESTHVFAFRAGDRRDLQALRDGVSDAFAAVVAELPKFTFAHVDKWDGRITTGTVRDLDSILGSKAA